MVVENPEEETYGACAWRITSEFEHPTQSEARKQKLEAVLEESELPQQEKTALLRFIRDHNHAFSLDWRRENEARQTLSKWKSIPTKKTANRRMPPAVRQKVARQLEQMQQNGVIEPSKSPWASPVLLVRKRDGSHTFCVDYWSLN